MLALTIFPASHPASIVGGNELNFCVRDGNRWTLTPISTNYMKKKIPHAAACGIWQGMRDSNPRKRSQSPVCYRYTNPLSATSLLYSVSLICQQQFARHIPQEPS